MPEFTLPHFLENRSVDDFYNRMKQIIPADLDLSEGGHAWNMTRPAALVAAEICEFILPEAIKVIVPDWAYGDYLTAHGNSRGITRRAATAASGEITITGAAETKIPLGSVFSTASVSGEASVDYATTEEATIPAEGTVTVPIRCTQTGTAGNTAAGTIVFVSGKIGGISAVTNQKPVTGGSDEEDDESLRERISDYDKSQGDSYVGSAADYKRWAESVPGVGEATVVPAQDDSGTVTIILTDTAGEAATDELRANVYNYIMRPDSPGERLANINAKLVVQAPSTMSVGVSATVQISTETTLEAVKAAFLRNLSDYLPTAMDDEEIRISKVAAALSLTAGVEDCASVKIGIKSSGVVNFGTSNIPIKVTQLPTVELKDLVLTQGEVRSV